MQSGVKPKATDDPHDFVVVPSDQVRVAPSDAEITDLLRAAARRPIRRPRRFQFFNSGLRAGRRYEVSRY